MVGTTSQNHPFVRRPMLKMNLSDFRYPVQNLGPRAFLNGAMAACFGNALWYVASLAPHVGDGQPRA
jgi:hypothetical protein